MHMFVGGAFGIVFFLFALALYFGLLLGVGWVLIYFLTPVAYRRWKQVKADDELKLR
ncbi:MAG: hypothetical protein ACYDGR_13325 [Candidatus Dormibacteria bacterium]